MHNDYILVPAKELSDAGKKLSVFMAALASVGRSICRFDNIIRSDFESLDFEEDPNEITKEMASKLPADTVALASLIFDDKSGYYKVDTNNIVNFTDENLGEYIRLVLVPDMTMNDELQKVFDSIVVKFSGIYDAAFRLVKKTGTLNEKNFDVDRLIDVGLMNIINDLFNKFCKDHRDALKIKFNIALILDPEIAPAFNICSYLNEKDARVALAPNKENLYRFFYPLSKDQVTSGMFWNSLEDVPYVNALVLAIIQEGIGGVLDTSSLKLLPLGRGAFSCFYLPEEEIENFLKIARKVHSGTYKYVFHFHPDDDVFRINEDGNIAVNVDLFHLQRKETKENDENGSKEEA